MTIKRLFTNVFSNEILKIVHISSHSLCYCVSVQISNASLRKIKSSSTCQGSREREREKKANNFSGCSTRREVAWYHVPCCRCHYRLLRFSDLVSLAIVPCYGRELSSVLSGLNGYPLPPPVATPTLYRHSKLIFRVISYKVTLIQSLCLGSENNYTKRWWP